ncbi:MAG: response regulator [Pseudolabrys sp.]|jgi:two-component system, LuxR family, response regulator FixJ
MPMTSPIRNVFIIDDDSAMRDALAVVFTLAHYRVSLFPDAESFLAAVPMKAPAALLIDMHLPRISGLDLLKRLDAGHYGAPIVMISADATVANAVEAVKRGAFDYLIKPLDGRHLVARIGGAIAGFERRQSAGVFPGQMALTPREREVLDAIAGGASNKEAGRKLGISPRTIEVHRARIMKKTGARNAADLVRIVLHGADGDRDGPAGHTPEMVA